MVVSEKKFQDVIDQVNSILTKLDKRITELESKKETRTTKTYKSQEEKS